MLHCLFLLNQLRLAANVSKWYPKCLQMVSKVFAKVEQCLLLWLSCTCDRIRKENVKACRVTLNLNSLSNFRSFRLQSKCKETVTNHGRRVAMLLQKMGNVDLPRRAGQSRAKSKINRLLQALQHWSFPSAPLSIIATPITLAQSIIFQQQQSLSAPSL